MAEESPTGVPDRVPVPGVRRGPAARRTVLYVATLLFLGALLGLGTPKGLLEETLYGLRHALAFGFASLIVLELTALVGRRWIRKRSLYYLIAFVVTVAAAAVFHVVRDGNWDLFVRDAAGILGFLLISASLDKPLRREHYWLRGWPRRITEVLGVLLLVAVYMPLVSISLNYAGRAGAFPVVVDLAAEWQVPFVRVEHAELFRGDGPEAWPRRAGREVALVLFDGTVGGGVEVSEVYKDWTGFDTLSLHIFSPREAPVELVLRLSDRTPAQPPDQRMDWPLMIRPGANDFYLDLEELRMTPSGRAMKLSTMRRVGLFLAEPSEPFRLYVHHLRISRE
ncbi:MAG: hypothetical protein P8080_02465 [Gammaproteobacteria bacterium]